MLEIQNRVQVRLESVCHEGRARYSNTMQSQLRPIHIQSNIHIIPVSTRDSSLTPLGRQDSMPILHPMLLHHLRAVLVDLDSQGQLFSTLKK